MLKVESGKENFSSTKHTSFALASLDKIITGFTALKMPLIYLNMYTSVHAHI